MGNPSKKTGQQKIMYDSRDPVGISKIGRETKVGNLPTGDLLVDDQLLHK